MSQADAAATEVIQPHPKGGPMPTMPGRRLLAQVIQRARGRVHAGDEPMDVARQALEALAAGGPLDLDDAVTLVGYLVKASDSAGRQDLMRTQREVRRYHAEQRRIAEAAACVEQVVAETDGEDSQHVAARLRSTMTFVGYLAKTSDSAGGEP